MFLYDVYLFWKVFICSGRCIRFLGPLYWNTTNWMDQINKSSFCNSSGGEMSAGLAHAEVGGDVESVLCFPPSSWYSWLVDGPLQSLSCVVVPSLSCVTLSVTPWTAARQASLSFTISWNLLKFICIESVMPSNHLILCRPLLLLPSIPPSIRVFSNKSALCITWPKYSFSFSISPSDEYSGLISFRMDWLDLLVVQGTLQHQESSPTPQFKSINSLVLSLLYSPAFTSIHGHWKDHSFDFVKPLSASSLLFNTLSRLIITFLPRSKHLLISWLQSWAAVILERKKKPFTVTIVSPSTWHEVMGTDAIRDLSFWTLSFKAAFSLSSFTFIKRLFSSSSLSAIRWLGLNVPTAVGLGSVRASAGNGIPAELAQILRDDAAKVLLLSRAVFLKQLKREPMCLFFDDCTALTQVKFNVGFLYRKLCRLLGVCVPA